MKRNTKPTVSIGITAFNESKNIATLIEALMKQVKKNYSLKEIIVISDGSTDSTVDEINKIKNPLIRIIDGKNRKGQTARQNEIINLTKGKYLVLVEADTLPSDRSVLTNLVSKITERSGGQVGMVVGGYIQSKPSNFYSHIMVAGDSLKRNIFENWREGDNIYWLGGHSIKILSSSFFKKLRIPSDVPEDAYLCIKAKELGFRVLRVKNANMRAGVVTSFSDSISQSNKFITGVNSIEKYFGRKTRINEYSIPKNIIIKESINSIIDNPFWTSVYLMSLTFNRLFSTSRSTMNPTYKIYSSSKKIR